MRILFADDEPSIQELMRIELPRLGHEATVCPDGTTALAALDRTAYDCVVVDLDMPGVGGMGVIARVRATAPDTEAVIITGKSSVETAIEAVRQGGLRISDEALPTRRHPGGARTGAEQAGTHQPSASARAPGATGGR